MSETDPTGLGTSIESLSRSAFEPNPPEQPEHVSKTVSPVKVAPDAVQKVSSPGKIVEQPDAAAPQHAPSEPAVPETSPTTRQRDEISKSDEAQAPAEQSGEQAPQTTEAASGDTGVAVVSARSNTESGRRMSTGSQPKQKLSAAARVSILKKELEVQSRCAGHSPIPSAHPLAGMLSPRRLSKNS